VLVQIRPEHEGEAPKAVVKRLVKRTGNKIVLEQYNPAKKFDVRTEDIVSIHRVVGSGEF
jgi:phage repressor protein C with HTH and peptisase S24 domain